MHWLPPILPEVGDPTPAGCKSLNAPVIAVGQMEAVAGDRVAHGVLCCQAQAEPLVSWGHIWQGDTSAIAALLPSSPVRYKSLCFTCVSA